MRDQGMLVVTLFLKRIAYQFINVYTTSSYELISPAHAPKHRLAKLLLNRC